MKYEMLRRLNDEIIKTKECPDGSKPVINVLRPSQKYLIISSDPSSDTDKDKATLDKHSSFEERVLALVFFRLDDSESVQRIRDDYSDYKDEFLDNFYWTHYSKCYAAGQPDNFWADKFLEREIELFEPELMIVFGGRSTNFLLGKGRLKDRVNKVLDWNGVPTICCLHPSRNWNLQRRDEYDFEETWVLIRSKVDID